MASLLLSLEEMRIGVEWRGANIKIFSMFSPDLPYFLFCGILLKG